MKAIVTGASGLIGSQLCKRLVEDGNDVVGLVHKFVNPMLLDLEIGGNFRMRVCDIRDNKDVSYMMDKVAPDVVFHLAACLPHIKDKDYDNTNVSGTQNLINASLGIVDKFIYASSMSVYTAPPFRVPVWECDSVMPESEYGLTKLEGERLCMIHAKEMTCVVLRFASVYGFWDTSRVAAKFMKAALNNEPIYIDGDGKQSSDFIYVDDAVNGLILAYQYGSTGVYNIGSGVETNIKQLAKKIIKATDSKSELIMSGNKVDRPFRFAADITKARKELNYSPMKIDDGLRRYAEEMKNGKR